MSKDAKALIIEGHRPGVRFGAGFAAWSNGSVCPDAIAEKLRADGYTLRPARGDEIYVDDPSATRVIPWPAAPGVPFIKNGA